MRRFGIFLKRSLGLFLNHSLGLILLIGLDLHQEEFGINVQIRCAQIITMNPMIALVLIGSAIMEKPAVRFVRPERIRFVTLMKTMKIHALNLLVRVT